MDPKFSVQEHLRWAENRLEGARDLLTDGPELLGLDIGSAHVCVRLVDEALSAIADVQGRLVAPEPPKGV